MVMGDHIGGIQEIVSIYHVPVYIQQGAMYRIYLILNLISVLIAIQRQSR